ncbi:hypothetical protein GCM10018779_25860 [Streptomyces griseocarneus]|nr:hypothetical protein GCM10018779_25860 [Streptomyces griseocarneus]
MNTAVTGQAASQIHQPGAPVVAAAVLVGRMVVGRVVVAVVVGVVVVLAVVVVVTGSPSVRARYDFSRT